MLAKMTVKNQLTLPKAVATQFRGVEYFDVSTDGSAIVLKPLRPSRLDEVRAKLEQLGITEQDVTDAIAWARRSEWDLPTKQESSSTPMSSAPRSSSPMAS